MTQTQKYSGGCHCGKVRYEVTADMSQVISCNCTICHKKGYILTFVPGDQLTLQSGEDVLSDYQFNKKNVHHLFCKECGVGSFGRGTMPDGKEMYAVNVRCLDGVDISALTLTPVDGKNF